ncbi:hypothetical protein JW960_28125 [candidate division KSB1 bacterium]|nr:hypothetical protein [candidate division KSB1 bacterium]
MANGRNMGALYLNTAFLTKLELDPDKSVFIELDFEFLPITQSTAGSIVAGFSIPIF